MAEIPEGPLIVFRCYYGIITGGYHIHQAWIQRDTWNSKRVGIFYNTIEEAQTALMKEWLKEYIPIGPTLGS